jgi:transposase-like protein
LTSAPRAERSVTIVEFLSVWARDTGVILRSRIPAEKKVLAAIMSASGYTYRDTSKILGGISHVAVHDAHKNVMAGLPPLQKKRREVDIEENVVDLNSEMKAVVWLAMDVDSGEILSFRCSTTRSPMDQRKFIDSVLSVCTERPLLRVDRGSSYPSSLRQLDLYFQIVPTGTPIRKRITNFFLGESETGSKG